MAGIVQNQDSYMQSVAAQRPFFFDHILPLTDQCMEEYSRLTGRNYRRVLTYKADDAEYLILGQGSVVENSEAVVDYLRETRGIKIGVVNIVMFRPFPGDLLGPLLKGRKGVAVLERTDQPLAEDLPLMREIRAALGKCEENGRSGNGHLVYPAHDKYVKPQDTPPLYSGCFGLGSRDLQPEGLIAAVENMIPGGKQKKQYYLSIDFIREKAYTPKQEIYQQHIMDSYPEVKDLAIRGSENPNLLPKNSITVRFHSVGGWGAITTGKNLAMTLFELLDFHIRANPKYGSEKKGQPTTYYLSAAPEPIRINCEYFYVDVVLSPDPNVFGHSMPIAGLKKGGAFIIQSDLESAQAVWDSFPKRAQQMIVDNGIRVFYLDAFKIAREEATDPELQFRMQGIAFQGAFFKASPVMKQAGLEEATLFKAIEDQLKHKFGGKGARVVEDNVRVVRRGFDHVQEIIEKTVKSADVLVKRKEADVPVLLKAQPGSLTPATDIHRFWEQTGSFYLTGRGNDNLTDPFIGLSCIPASTGVFRDMSSIRFAHPEWVPANCTACGKCYSVCPDSAIPGLVNSFAEVMDTAVKMVEDQGHALKHLRKAARTVERKLQSLIADEGEKSDVNALLKRAVEDTVAQADVGAEDRSDFEQELGWFSEAIGDFKFSITKPYYVQKEKAAAGSGGLLSITVNPYTCKGCMECVAVCNDNALRSKTQSAETIDTLRKDWAYWMALPTTSPEFIRIEDLNEKVGALETLLLDKRNYMAMTSGDGACLGCGEKTAMHIFCAVVEALMQPRVKKHVAKLTDLIAEMEKHIRLKLADTMDLADSKAIESAIELSKTQDLTLSNLTAALDQGKTTKPLDPEWLRWATQLLAKLKHLKWQYTDGISNHGRSSMGMINSTGCTSVWASTYPFNPYPFPWTNHLFQDSTSMAMGIFEGHMSKMAEGFRAVRMAEMELAGKYNEGEQKDFFTYFNWRDFTDEEYLLCPPVVAVGGDGSMYDIGFQNLSRMLMSGKPIKVFVLDTQVYSNTGGQACTSGFTGQISDMAQYGKAFQGKEEVRKEIGLIGMAHRTAYVMQGAISNMTHLIEGFIDGMNTRRPALFNVYAACMPEHGIADDVADKQSKLAVESRAYPIFRYNPDNGVLPSECFDLTGNPAIDEDWPTYALDYVDEDGKGAKLEVPLTFADFAVTEARFRKHFRKAPRDTWNENMIPLASFVDMPVSEREGLFPYIWALDKKNHLTRIIPAAPVVKATEDRKDFWKMLRALSGVYNVVDPEAIRAQVRGEMTQKLASGLMQLALGGSGADLMATLSDTAVPVKVAQPPAGAVPAASGNGAPAGDGYKAAWIDSAQCTACDECININPKIFAYSDKKQAYVKDPKGGPYKDLVRAAEKCTAQVIHPGTPADKSEKGLDKLLKRAEKYK